MSRARTLASILGSDGALNAGDVSGLAAVATSGSASDLSTGTLPIARVADGAVVNAKLGSDIDASKLTAGVLPGGRMPTGTVLQTVTATASTTYTAGVNTIAYVDALEVSLTPRSTNSKIVIFLHADFQHNTTSGDGHVNLARKIGSGGTWVNADGGGSVTAGNAGVWTYLYSNFSLNNGTNPVIKGGGVFVDSPGTTNTVYYKPYILNVSVTTGSANVKFGAHAKTYLIAQEIQG